MMSLIEMTLEGAVIIAVIILVRSLTIHRLPKKAFLLLWAVALIRLLVPVRISSPSSIYSVTPDFSSVRRPGILLPETAARTAAQISGTADLSVPPWMIVWGAGALLLGLGILICHIRHRRVYRTSLPVEDMWIKSWVESHRLRRPVFVRCSDQTDAPLTYGVLWPVILLPSDMDWSDETLLGFVLAHEMSHIRRFDALTKWFLAAVLCLHWFNPFVWVMYILANRDLELSCDESVVQLYGPQSKADYALTLVGMEERRTEYAPLASCFCRSALKERITAIMKSRKKSVISLAAAAVLIGMIVIVFATDAPAAESAAREPQAAARGMQDTASAARDNPAGTAVEDDISRSMRTITKEIAQETFTDQEDPNDQEVTKAQCKELMNSIKLDGYEEMSIAEFNRKIYALLSGDDDDKWEQYEQILASMPKDDPDAVYLFNTVQASLVEYTARMDEVYSGKQNDPEFYGSADRDIEENVFGDKVVTGSRCVSYSFTYRILDQDKLTVKERDAFLQNIIRAIQDKVDENTSDAFTEKEFQNILTEAGDKASGEKITFTGGEITDLESY